MTKNYESWHLEVVFKIYLGLLCKILLKMDHAIPRVTWETRFPGPRCPVGWLEKKTLEKKVGWLVGWLAGWPGPRARAICTAFKGR